MSEPQPHDVTTASGVLAALVAVGDADPRWPRRAAPTTWTAAQTLAHIADALLFYAGQVARRADHRLPVLRDGRAGPPSEHLDNAVTAAHVLAGLLRDLGPARAWHPSGLADASGWAGMAVTEILVHGHDVACALEIDFPLPERVCQRTLARVFPWVPLDLGPPEVLILAVTGRAVVQGIPSDPEWWWQSAPLAEWDGQPRRRTSPPRWL
ncbi:MAG: hypothetical protein ACRDRP_10195 [Pseudonocardiaceae bacterium]